MLVSSAEGYAKWAQTYDQSANPVVALETRCVEQWIGRTPGCLIDVGCGTGRRIASGGFGIDLSREMLSSSRAGGRIVQGDALRLPFRDAVADVVVCSLALSYLRPPAAAVREMLRITRPGGSAIVIDMHPVAVKEGWKHSFRIDGTVYEIENHPYALEDLPTEGLEQVCDAFFGEPEKPIFERAGKIHYFAEACQIPALWMLRWRAR